MSKQTIHIEKPAIAFREEAFEIEKKVKKLAKNSSAVFIDFSDVKFISRSFADELINSIEQLKRTGINVILQHVPPNAKKMLSLVKAARKNVLRQAGSFKMRA